MFYQLEFEKPLIDIEQRLTRACEQLQRARAQAQVSQEPGPMPALAAEHEPSESLSALQEQVSALEAERDRALRDAYEDIGPWDIVRVARHPGRPQTRDYVGMMCRDFCELHGDRRYGDDPAIVCGLARIGSFKCLVVGHQKGRETAEKLSCHFGCAHPEGYRKALLKMQLAEKLGLPIVTLVDTPGAYPGIGAEQRGQAEAIAVNLREMSRLKTPIVSVIIGEGGSGGALGIAVADRVAMLQYAWYSVISPEGCAAILWKQASEQTNRQAANALRLSASDNLELGIVDAVIDEPLGGAHRDPKGAATRLERWVVSQLEELTSMDKRVLTDARYERYRRLGQLLEVQEAPPDADSSGSPMGL
ncbi:MAG: acetyl-CoA carboxylase carboxyltransferase subunit alpha [Phycisphaeraceae bacterium]|nr:acetyl-CoA carboxylase carboxyltransferase subunit alpha [Phycisphaeraceae bacterium]